MRILIIEDEKELRDALSEGLTLNGFAVDGAGDGMDGLELLSINSYDLLILDLNLPGMDGMEILKRVRMKDSSIRVIILSARDGIEDRVCGIDSGADDYMVKPFHFDELVARIRGLLRRRFDSFDNIISIEGLSVNLKTHEVTVSGNLVQLRPKEYGILEYLVLNQGRYVSQEELIEHVWNEEADPFMSSVRVHVSHIRKKLMAFTDHDFIESSPRLGYMIRK